MKRTPTDAGGAEGAALRAVLGVVEQLTHIRPTTCPWRAMSEPIVKEVLAVSWACDPPNLAGVLGADPDHKLTQAVGVYRRALRATFDDEMRLQRDERDQLRKAKAAANQARGGRHG